MKIAIALALGICVLACSKTKSPAEAEQGLDSPDPAVRRDSAHDLRAGNKVPDDAVPKLMIAAKNEKDPDALSAMLVTLGVSGSPAAHDTICTHFHDQDNQVAHASAQAIDLWLEHNPEQGGCSMSQVDQVPASEGPSHVDTKPAKHVPWTNSLR